MLVLVRSNSSSFISFESISDAFWLDSSILAEWKDNQGELVVELNGTQAARLIGFEAALFVDLEEERKRYALDALIGRTFKLKFVKVRIFIVPKKRPRRPDLDHPILPTTSLTSAA